MRGILYSKMVEFRNQIRQRPGNGKIGVGVAAGVQDKEPL